MLYDGSSADAVTEKLRLAYLVLAILLFNAAVIRINGNIMYQSMVPRIAYIGVSKV